MVSSVGGGGGYTGISGLVSGLDTESIVKKMTAASTAKIDKVNQQKQLLLWQQEDYRSIISKLMDFQGKYFNTLSGSNVLSSKFFVHKTAVMLNPEHSRFVSVSLPANTSMASIELSNIKLATSSKAASQNAVSQQIAISFDPTSAPVDLTGRTMDVTVDGVTKTIEFSGIYHTSQQLGSDIQTLLNDAFGIDRLSVSVLANEITINSDGVDASLAPGSLNSVFDVSGLALTNDHTSRIDMRKSIEQTNFTLPVTGDNFGFHINGVKFEFQKQDTIATVINKINASDAGVNLSYSSITDKFTLTSNMTGSTSNITISDETGNFLSSVIGPLTGENYTAGTDASVYINGTKVTRSSNSFTIDGITYSLKAETADTINMNITSDTEEVLANIKDFVNDYNEILDAINTKLSEARYREFAPLTEEQKKEMSETEVKLWEEKSKSGLLKNDDNLQRLVRSLRSAFYMPVKNLDDNTQNLGLNITDVGITTDNYFSGKTKGGLVIDEQKLTQAMEKDAQSVIDLFTQASDKIYTPDAPAEYKEERYNESGLMHRLSDILNDYVGKTLGSGILLKKAGYPGSSTEFENTVTKRIKSYEQKLDRLLDSLKREENRYFSQFTAMEKYLAMMNQQAAWLNNSLE